MQKDNEEGLDIQLLKSVLPPKIYENLPIIIQKYQINTPLRLCHFLSQCAHQSNDFKRVTESLVYTTTKRLRQIFPKYIKTQQQATQFLKNPQKLANKVYCNRNGNGTEQSNDGYNFIGRGYIQLTGRDNYANFSNFIGDPNIMKNPSLIAEKYALQSAAYFWKCFGNCNSKADEGADDQTVKKVTKLINGGVNGLKDRIQKFYYFCKLFLHK